MMYVAYAAIAGLTEAGIRAVYAHGPPVGASKWWADSWHRYVRDDGTRALAVSSLRATQNRNRSDITRAAATLSFASKPTV
ncbi:MAG TPA: hypothetical protein VNA66_04665 [Gammaproteobacteria bacterium]|nr:hypothetical protein [Gammaproteobacteria bacterium]